MRDEPRAEQGPTYLAAVRRKGWTGQGTETLRGVGEEVGVEAVRRMRLVAAWLEDRNVAEVSESRAQHDIQAGGAYGDA